MPAFSRLSQLTSRLSALAIVAVLATTACVATSDVSSLASTSAQVADELSAVYVALSQASGDALTVRTAAFTLGVTKAPDTPDYNIIKFELNRRVALATSLGGLFKSLAALAGSKVSAQAATDAGKIGDAIQKLGVVQGRGGPDPKTALAGVAQLFFSWRVNQDLETALQQTKPAVQKIADFYAGESDTAYLNITHDNAEALDTFREKLVELNLVKPGSLLGMLADPYGVTVGAPQCPPKTDPDCLNKLAEALIEVRATRLETALNGAVGAMGQTLGALADGYDSFLSGKSAHVDLINQYLGRTKAYLEEAGQLRPMAPTQTTPK